MTAKDESETILVRIPMKQRRRSGRKQIILPEGPEATNVATPAAPSSLARAIARAYEWQRMIDSGVAAGLEAIAAQYDVDRSYVSRIITLATLAPGIVEAVLANCEPKGLSLSRLRESLSFRWDEQRETV